MEHKDPLVLTALGRLDAVDPSAAIRAEEALAWLLGGAPLSQLSQAQLQQFVWYELPFKWVMAADAQWRVCDALGRFLDLAGLTRYAECARSGQTRAVIDTYADRGAATGFDTFLRAHEASGVVPPDLAELTWAELMGPAEERAFWSCSKLLELAVEGGALKPGSPDWRAERVALVLDHLRRPQPEHFGESLLQDIVTERIARWADDGRSRARTQLLSHAERFLLDPQPPPVQTLRRFCRVRWLLSVAARPPRGRVQAKGPSGLSVRAEREYTQRFAWWWRPDQATGSGQDPADLGLLVDLAHRAGLVERVQGRFRATPDGADIADDRRRLWGAVAGAFTEPDLARHPGPVGGHNAARRAFRADLAELAFAVVLVDRVARWSELGRAVQVALTEMGWHGGVPGRPVPGALLDAELERLAIAGDALGFWQFRPGGRVTEPALRVTSFGEKAILAALRVRAVSPGAA